MFIAALLLAIGSLTVFAQPRAISTATYSPVALGWTIQGADAPKWFANMGHRSLRVDSGGNPHIAYGGDSFYYA